MSTPQRLPIVNNDDGSWGDIIRSFLMKEHINTDTDSATNGGHKTVTIQAGTAAGPAPLTFNTGPLLTTAVKGSMEFNNNSYYLTTTTSQVRKKIGIFDDSSGAVGDIYYRDSEGNLSRLALGTAKQRLGVNTGTGIPAWADPDLTLPQRAISADTTVLATDAVIFVTAASNNVNITLPAASTVAAQRYFIKRTDAASNTVTITPNGSETIDGYNTLTLGEQYASILIVAAGGLWYILD